MSSAAASHSARPALRSLLAYAGCPVKTGASSIGLALGKSLKSTSSPARSKGPDLEGEEPRLKQLFHLAMLARGIYLSPRGTLALSLPMGEPETDALLVAVDAFVEDYGPLLPRAGAVA